MKQIQKNYMVPVLCTAILLGVSGYKGKTDVHNITDNISQDIIYADLYEGYAEIEQEELQETCELYETSNVAECVEIYNYDEFKINMDSVDYEALYEAELEEWIEHYIGNLPYHGMYIQ